MNLELTLALEGLQVNPKLEVSTIDATTKIVLEAVAVDFPNGSSMNIAFEITPSSDFQLMVDGKGVLKTLSNVIKGGEENVSYDFTTSADQAIGSNLKDVDGVFMIYFGDFNNDGSIDGSDVAIYDANENDEKIEISLETLEENVSNSISEILT